MGDEDANCVRSDALSDVRRQKAQDVVHRLQHDSASNRCQIVCLGKALGNKLVLNLWCCEKRHIVFVPKSTANGNIPSSHDTRSISEPRETFALVRCSALQSNSPALRILEMSSADGEALPPSTAYISTDEHRELLTCVEFRLSSWFGTGCSELCVADCVFSALTSK